MDLKQRLADYFRANADYFNVEIQLLQYRVQVIGLDSLVDLPQSIAMLQTQTTNMVDDSLSPDSLLKIIGQLVDPDLGAIVPDIIKGNLIVLEPLSGTCCAVLPISKVVTRSIGPAETENTLYGSSSSFLEDLNTNIGILRKHCTSDQLESRNLQGRKEQSQSRFVNLR
ncbi:spore germination protein [Paenibacillus vortex]|uniref:spore germination protein n=1 Tax=Paenibacillus vortex TaxID=71995 RepID=UPI00031DE89E|nr:spore germination protein [Paenibacillus vortex]